MSVAAAISGCTLSSGPVAGGDSGKSDAGAGVDAAMSDGAVDGPAVAASSCLDVHAGALLCDGFQDPALEAWQADGATQVAMPAYRGMGALRARVSGPDGANRIVAAPAFAPRLAGDEIYTRGWFYVPAGSESSHVEILALHSSDFVAGLALVLFDDELRAYLSTEEANVSDVPGPVVPRDTWFCVEVRIVVGDADGQVEMWLDGVSAGGATGVDTLVGSGIDLVEAGIPFTGPSQVGQAEVFSDELVIDDQPVGCAP